MKKLNKSILAIVLTFTVVFGMVSVAFADTTIGNEDVAVVGDASVSSGMNLTKDLTSTVQVTITANDGKIPTQQSNQGWAKVPSSYIINGDGTLTIGSWQEPKFFTSGKVFSANNETLTFDISISFIPGTFSGVKQIPVDLLFGVQVIKATDFNAPIIYVNVPVTTPLDTTAPTITLTQSPLDWTNQDVIISATITDASGVAEQKWAVGNQDVAYFATEGTAFTGTTFTVSANGVYTVYAKDTKGNEGVKTITVANIDKVNPTITYSLDKAANAAGWYKEDVTVSFNGEDDENGSGIACVTAPVTLIEGKDQSVIGTATDKAGNSTSITVSGINIDKTVPTINAPADGQIFIQNSSDSPTWNAIDSLSGIATNEITGFSTSLAGTRSYTITATDKAGNVVSKTVSYVVWSCSGFLAPLKDEGTYKAGSTIPVKLILTTKDSEGNTVLVTDKDINFEWVYVDTARNNTGTPVVLSAAFRYDATAGQYIYNYKTLKTDAGKAIKITAKFNGVVLDEAIVNLK